MIAVRSCAELTALIQASIRPACVYSVVHERILVKYWYRLSIFIFSLACCSSMLLSPGMVLLTWLLNSVSGEYFVNRHGSGNAPAE